MEPTLIVNIVRRKPVMLIKNSIIPLYLETNFWYPKVVGKLLKNLQNGRFQIGNPGDILGFRARFYATAGLSGLIICKILEQMIRIGTGILQSSINFMMLSVSSTVSVAYWVKLDDPEDFVVLLNGLEQLELSLAGN